MRSCDAARDKQSSIQRIDFYPDSVRSNEDDSWKRAATSVCPAAPCELDYYVAMHPSKTPFYRIN